MRNKVGKYFGKATTFDVDFERLFDLGLEGIWADVSEVSATTKGKGKRAWNVWDWHLGTQHTKYQREYLCQVPKAIQYRNGQRYSKTFSDCNVSSMT